VLCLILFLRALSGTLIPLLIGGLVLLLLLFALGRAFGRGLRVVKLQEQERERWALAHGWEYERAPIRGLHFRLRGRTAAGLNWMMEDKYSLNQRQGSTAPLLTWFTDDIQLPELVLMVVSRSEYKFLKSIAGKALLGIATAALHTLGASHNPISEFIERAQAIEPRLPPVAKGFLILSTDEQLARELTGAEVETLLQSFVQSAVVWTTAQRSLTISLGARNLRVQLQSYDRNIETLRKIVRLGTTLAESYLRVSPR